MALGVLSLTCSAQVEKVVLVPAKQKKVTGFTLDSISKALPVPISQTLSTLSNDGRVWNIDFKPASSEINTSFYNVYLKGKNGKQTLTYDKDGNLLQVKQVLKNTEVPEPVKKTLNTKYNGWALVGNEERHIHDSDKATLDYKIILKKGILKKAVLVDPEGDVKLALPTV